MKHQINNLSSNCHQKKLTRVATQSLNLKNLYSLETKNPLTQKNQRVFLYEKAASCYSPTANAAVPSPLVSLTTVFGMGTGVSLLL